MANFLSACCQQGKLTHQPTNLAKSALYCSLEGISVSINVICSQEYFELYFNGDISPFKINRLMPVRILNHDCPVKAPKDCFKEAQTFSLFFSWQMVKEGGEPISAPTSLILISTV